MQLEPSEKRLRSRKVRNDRPAFEKTEVIDTHGAIGHHGRQGSARVPQPIRLGHPQHFPSLLPTRPLCGDRFEEGTYRMPRAEALDRWHVQVNRDNMTDWLLFDLDRPDAYEAPENAGLPEPTFISVNPANGHALAGYLLASPVSRYDASHREPISYLADVQRGMVRRLGADRAFNGIVVKNPLHARWRTEWRVARAYSLEALNANLDAADKRRESHIAREVGEGRNCTIFENLRTLAYAEVRQYFGNPIGFRARLLEICMAMNGAFEFPMSLREVSDIAKSIADWTLRNFDPERFSELQRWRGHRSAQKRWAGHDAESAAKPWQAMGVSRATFYRRKAASRIT